MILSAVYMLWMFRRVMFGPLLDPENRKMPDLNLREVLVMLPVTVMMFWMGLFPGAFLDRIEPSVDYFIQQYQRKAELSRNEMLRGDPLASKVRFVLPTEDARTR